MVNSLKLKSRLVEIGITQNELAKNLGLSAPTISQKINNLRPMNLEEAEKIFETNEFRRSRKDLRIFKN